ncbi:Histone deacetylase domain-containing protein [Plasmodiophora brassicae]|nr:hypothetical protein PBRA_002802 [Plasmodiophora brassicae]
MAAPAGATGIVYDDRCARHCLPAREGHVERPTRTIVIWETLSRLGLAERCVRIPARCAEYDELALTHSSEHIAVVMDSDSHPYTEEEPFRYVDPDTYVCPGTRTAALLAAGGLIDLCERVVLGELANGFSVMRPPGHHAGLDGPMGFCLFNNVAVAANVIQERYPEVQRILIVDWDVHHGNGTEDIFAGNDRVLFQSIHRGSGFYPCSGGVDDIGKGPALGYTVNVPLPRGGMGDAAYLEVFQKVFVPIANEFKPQLIIVSAGFDACDGDPLGGMSVTPKGFSQMLSMLIPVCSRIVLALEGGYNVQAIANCSAACLGVLLDGAVSTDSPAQNGKSKTRKQLLMQAEVDEMIASVRTVHLPFWSCFDEPHPLSDTVTTVDSRAATLLAQIDSMKSSIGLSTEAQASTVAAAGDAGIPSASEPPSSHAPAVANPHDEAAVATLCDALVGLAVAREQPGQ